MGVQHPKKKPTRVFHQKALSILTISLGGTRTSSTLLETIQCLGTYLSKFHGLLEKSDDQAGLLKFGAETLSTSELSSFIASASFLKAACIVVKLIDKL